jgi:hypothetical protein
VTYGSTAQDSERAQPSHRAHQIRQDALVKLIYFLLAKLHWAADAHRKSLSIRPPQNYTGIQLLMHVFADPHRFGVGARCTLKEMLCALCRRPGVMSVAPRKRCVLALTATVLLCSAMIVQADHEPLCISRPDSGSMECLDSLSQAGGDSCTYANDGECDEPENCAYGTDSSDCGGPYDAFTECEYYQRMLPCFSGEFFHSACAYLPAPTPQNSSTNVLACCICRIVLPRSRGVSREYDGTHTLDGRTGVCVSLRVCLCVCVSLSLSLSIYTNKDLFTDMRMIIYMYIGCASM